LVGGFELQDVGAYFFERAQGLVLVEIASEIDFVTHLRFAFFYPGIGRMGQHFPFEIIGDVFFERHVFKVPQTAVGLWLAFFQHGLFFVIQQRPLHRDAGVPKVGIVNDFAAVARFVVAVDAGDFFDLGGGDSVSFVAEAAFHLSEHIHRVH